MSKDDLLYIEHIRDCIKRIEQFMERISFEDFLNNEEKQSAVIRNFEIIGEASSKVSEEFRKKNLHLPWKQMKDMRNFLIHDYEEIDLNVVWDAVKINLPVLKIAVENILN